MFRPFIGEIITGKIEESDANGLRCMLNFFLRYRRSKAYFIALHSAGKLAY